MSEALLCDRCGKKMVKFVGLRLESKWSMFAMKYDLCPNCTEDFRKFMKKKEREENAAALHFKCNSSRHIQAIYGPGFYAAEFAIDEAPTIDPNDLSVVQELRANIAILEQIIRNGSNPIDKDKIVSLMMENAALKSQIVNITAEKNAAINDLLQVGRGYDFCTVCAHCCEGGKPKYRPQEPYMEFCKKCNDDYSQFEWRDLKGAHNADQKLYDEN